LSLEGRVQVILERSEESNIKEVIMKNKGFSIIELLVSLGISSIISGLIFSFFIINYKGYKSMRNDSEMQFQAQYILNFIAGRIINSNSISFVRVNTQNYSVSAVRSAGVEYPIHKISFKCGNENENFVFHIINNTIRYGKGEKEMNPTVELGNYVDEMYVSLLKDESFQDAKAVKLKLIMKKDGQSHEAFQAVYMRNN
jgi:prepilin-type N-terminal cleavage/methylation domain-containing protein